MKSHASVPQLLGFVSQTLGKGVVLAALATQLTVNAAEPVVQWAKVVGGSGHDWPEDLAFAPNGQLYLVGDINQKVLHRFDRNGTLLGTQASRGEYIRSVATDSAGNYYLTGLIRDSRRLGVGLTNDFYLAKYSSAGSVIWERTGGTLVYSNIYPWNLGGFKVALDPAGNIYVAGGSTGPAVFSGMTFPATAGGPLLCKYTPDGTLLWVKRTEGAYNGFNDGGTATSLALSPDGSIVMTGFLHNGEADFGGVVVDVAGRFDSDSFVAKFSPAGEVQWARLSHGGYSVRSDSGGNVYSIGASWIDGDFGLHCTKFGPSGDALWERRIPGATGECIALEGDDTPVISGRLYTTVQLDDITVPYNGMGSGDYYPEALICKADATGRFQWALTESGAAFASGGPLLSDRSGNIYFAGALRCDYAFGQYSGCTATLGSFALDVLYPNADNQSDVSIARLFDADGVVPELKVGRTASSLALSWPTEATNYVLEASTSLAALSWDTVTNTPTVGPIERSVQLPLTDNAKFFRLRKP